MHHCSSIRLSWAVRGSASFEPPQVRLFRAVHKRRACELRRGFSKVLQCFQLQHLPGILPNLFGIHTAAAQGAPQATQCADRFHLMKNLGEAVEDLLARHLSAARKRQVEVALEEQTPAWLPERTARRAHTSEDLPSAYQQDRLARYQQMIQLHEQGMTQGAIAQQLALNLNTARR